jgi:branched-chain amino acid transport system substrate-binding protein
MEKKRRLLLGLTALALAAAPAWPSAAQDNHWKFTSLQPITGAYANYAVEFKLGFEIGRDEINANGGILGRPIDVEILDTQSNNGQVVSLVRQACSNSFAELGPSMSNEAQVAFPVANQMGCPAISSSATSTGLTTRSRPWTFTYASPATVITPQAVDLLIQKLKPKSAVVVIDRGDASANDQGPLAVKALKDKGVETNIMYISDNDLDFGPTVTRIAGLKPDLVILSTKDKGAVGMLKEMKSAHSNAAILITQSAFTPLVMSAGPEVLEGVYRYTEFDPTSSDDPRVKAFVEEFKKRNNGRAPTQLSTQPYDLMFLVKHLLEEIHATGDADKLDSERKAFAEHLAALKDWPSIAGPMSITPEGFATKPVTVLVFHGGKPERVSAE